MNRPLYYLCLLLTLLGLGLLAAAAVQEFAGIELFSEPPWLVGVGLATIGGLMVAGFRRTHAAG